MEFDKSRIYSAVNADELKPGDKVVVADNLADLKEFVRKNDVHEIEDILSDKCSERFGVCGMANYALAYLVERAENCTNCSHSCKSINPCLRYEPKTEQKAEHDCKSCKYKNCGFKYLNTKNECDRWETEPKAEPHYRPFRDTDELIKVWMDGGKYDYKEMPLIWVRQKECGEQSLITGFDKNGVKINGVYVKTFEVLLGNYEFLDGSVCGVEE